MQSNHFTITVSGGDSDSNRKMTCAVHDALKDHHFSNVKVDLPEPAKPRGSLETLHSELRNMFVRIVPETLETRRASQPFDFTEVPYAAVPYDFAL